MGNLIYKLGLLPLFSKTVKMKDLEKREDGVFYSKENLKGYKLDIPYTGYVVSNLLTNNYIRGRMVNGRKDGEWILMSDHCEEIEEKGTYTYGLRQGEHLWYGFNFGGVGHYLQEKGNYVNGKKEGEYLHYRTDGKVQIECNYKNDKLDGIQYVYPFYDNDNHIGEYHYKDGIALSADGSKKAAEGDVRKEEDYFYMFKTKDNSDYD